MTDPNTPPSGPSPVVEALAQLNDPRYLLAEALAAVRAAQAVGQDIDANPVRDDGGEQSAACFDRLDRHRRLLDEAFQLGQIARHVAEVNRADMLVRSLTDASLDDEGADMGLRTVPPADLIRGEAPRALNGVRFTATVTGQYLGQVGGRVWMWTQACGYIDVTNAVGVYRADADGVAEATFSGAVKSVTGDQALCVTHGGQGVVLPRALMVEGPDE